MPLASLVMDMDEDDCPVWHNVGIGNISDRLELRAMFRLCGALFYCKGGAAQEALGLIDDIGHTRIMYEPERRCFRELGDGIVDMVTKVMEVYRQDGQETDDEHVVLMPVDGIESLRTKPETMLKTRVTLAPALKYWDDMYEPDFTKSDTHQELGDLVATSSDSCTPAVIDQSSIDLLPRIELRASRDHLPGDPILYDRGPWNVTTSSPENVLDAWHTNKAGRLRLHCDNCATALLMPEDLVAYAIADANLEESSNAGVTRDLKRISNDEEMSKEQREKRIAWSSGTHITFCSPDHEAIYCCTTCRRNRRLYDLGVHESKLELELRNGKALTTASPLENVSPGHPRSFYGHSKTQTLYDLLFLRIYASALNHDKHPLDLVKFLRGGLSPASAHAHDQASDKKPRQIPWSFQNNVVRPIWIIDRYHQAMKQDPVLYLKQSDGWVINTLLAKIQHSVTIGAGAMSAIVYNIDKGSKTYCYRGLERWVGDGYDAVYESEEAFNEVWVGRLDPLVSMIRLADEARGEKPNCWLKYDEGVKIIAGQPDDPSNKKSAAIRQGEPLLRAKPKFLGGSPYEVVPYSQRVPVPSNKLKRSESPVKKDHGADHDMADTVIQSVESEAADQDSTPDSQDDSSDTSNSSDEEMLDILDHDSPDPPGLEGQLRPPSPPSSPVDAEYIANLDGQAEALSRRLEAVPNVPALVADDGDEEEDEWDHVEIQRRRLRQKQRRFSDASPRDDSLMAQYRAAKIRVTKYPVCRPPRDTLEERAIKGDVRRSAPTSPQVGGRSSVALQDDAFGDLPLGQILTSAFKGEKKEERLEAPVALRPKKLETRSITDVRRGTPPAEHDPSEGSSSGRKGKAVMRGGDALYTVCDGASDEETFKSEA